MAELKYPADRRYHAGHLWAKDNADGTWLIGITDFAQQQLGEVLFVDLPAEGAHFDQGVSCADIESSKAVSDAILPLSGTVVEVNAALEHTPGLLNREPYDAGWLVRLKADDADDERTLDAEAYKALVAV
ncbi:MAG: glycine cleavage system protein GcvH [Desulfovibrio sp.]|jgi:glycine cleavage system H protein|nr:glycine cleavage system protein GcvH [Desulfovibrio sp.]